jgi:SET domain-containing protein
MKKVNIKLIEGKGRGLFAGEFIKKGDVIELCPTIVLTEKDAKYVWNESDILKYYFFIDDRGTVIMFGKISMCNHSLENNCEVDNENLYLYKLVAIKDINIDEELTINYHFDNEEEYLPIEHVNNITI